VSTPVLWSLDLSALPVPLATYLSPQLGSPFPLFPWTAFVLCGLVAGHIFVTARRLGDERQLMSAVANLFCVGLLLVMVGPVVDSHIVDLYPRGDVENGTAFFAGTPGFFALRLGIVLTGFSVLALRTRALQPRSPIVAFLQIVGQRSLLIYVLGLFLLFGWVLDLPRLVEIVGPTLNFAECVIVFVSVATATSLLGYAWHWCARGFRAQALVGQYAAMGLFVWLFLIRP
jgi:uncharacterized membrane protein